MELKFTGKITEIKPLRGGTGNKGEWANVEFEVTESNPANPQYPQVALFEFFKNGEYLKYAKDFATYYPLETEVDVEFNLKKNTYQNKENKTVNFYKTSAWKITKSGSQNPPATEQFEPAGELNKEADDLPF